MQPTGATNRKMGWLEAFVSVCDQFEYNSGSNGKVYVIAKGFSLLDGRCSLLSLVLGWIASDSTMGDNRSYFTRFVFVHGKSLEKKRFI